MLFNFVYFLFLVAESPSDNIYEHKKDQRLYHVHAKWVLDLDVYNEWMNELDYQVTINNRKCVLVFCFLPSFCL